MKSTSPPTSKPKPTERHTIFGMNPVQEFEFKQSALAKYLWAYRGLFVGDAVINIGIELARLFPDGSTPLPKNFRSPPKYGWRGFLHRLKCRFTRSLGPQKDVGWLS